MKDHSVNVNAPTVERSLRVTVNEFPSNHAEVLDHYSEIEVYLHWKRHANIQIQQKTRTMLEAMTETGGRKYTDEAILEKIAGFIVPSQTPIDPLIKLAADIKRLGLSSDEVSAMAD